MQVDGTGRLMADGLPNSSVDTRDASNTCKQKIILSHVKLIIFTYFFYILLPGDMLITLMSEVASVPITTCCFMGLAAFLFK